MVRWVVKFGLTTRQCAKKKRTAGVSTRLTRVLTTPTPPSVRVITLSSALQNGGEYRLCDACKSTVDTFQIRKEAEPAVELIGSCLVPSLVLCKNTELVEHWIAACFSEGARRFGLARVEMFGRSTSFGAFLPTRPLEGEARTVRTQHEVECLVGGLPEMLGQPPRIRVSFYLGLILVFVIVFSVQLPS